jgi:hypothetical protein
VAMLLLKTAVVFVGDENVRGVARILLSFAIS